MRLESREEDATTVEKNGVESDPTRARMPFRWRDVIFVGVAASFSTLQIMATNLVGIVHPERLLLLIAVGWLVGLGVFVLAWRLGASRDAASIVGVVFLVGFSRGAAATERLGLVAGLLVVAGFAVLVGLVSSRIRSEHLTAGLLVALSVFLISGPATALIRSLGERGTDDVVRAAATPRLELETTPDVFVVLVDGYAGLQTLEADFGVVSPRWFSALIERGFQIPTSAWSSYPTTSASVPSLLDMSYPVLAGEGIGPASAARLHEMASGDNASVHALKAAGYQITVIESGWSGSACTREIDHCVPSRFLDEGTFLAFGPTLLGPVLTDSYGSSFTVGALNTMKWVRENAPALTEDGKPDFVFAHVPAPHPPFYLDKDCRLDVSPGRKDFHKSEAEIAHRGGFYLDQAMCVDQFLVDLADEIPAADVVVVVADHGSDMRGQLSKPPDAWDVDDIRERLNVMVAARAQGCELGDDVVLPNVLRRVFSCLSTNPVPNLPAEMFLFAPLKSGGEPLPVISVPAGTVDVLMAR